METSYILKNESGYFVIVGVANQANFLSLNAPPPQEEEEEEEDDLDFEMF